MEVVADQIPGLITEWVSVSTTAWAMAIGVAVVLLILFRPFQFIAGISDRKLPPGPRGWPIVGNLLQLGSHPHRAMTAMHKKYGPIVYLRLGSAPTVVIDSPELIAEITTLQDSVFSSRPKMSFADIVSYESHDFAMAPYGPRWRYLRRICVHELLTPKRLACTAKQRSEEVACMISAILQANNKKKNHAFAAVPDAAVAADDQELQQQLAVLDMRDVLTGVSMAVMCRMILGRREFAATESDKAKDFKHLVHEIFRLMGAFNIRDYIPALGWLDLQGFERDMRKLRHEYEEVLDSVIQEHRDMASEKRPNRNPNDFISTLLEQPGENGEPHLDVRTIKSITMDMVAGGTDSSAVTNEWALMELIRHPEIQRKLQRELDAVVGGNRNVLESDLPNLPYLMCVVKETFRLHPPGSFSIPRESTADTTLNGFHIPKGTRVLVNVFSLGRREDAWTDPMRFQPERWLDEKNLTTIHDPAFRIYSFGFGRRQCPAYTLGSTMVLFTLARLLHGFHWSFPPGVTADTVDMHELYGITSPLRTPLGAVATPRLAPHLYSDSQN